MVVSEVISEQYQSPYTRISRFPQFTYQSLSCPEIFNVVVWGNVPVFQQTVVKLEYEVCYGLLYNMANHSLYILKGIT